MRKRSADLRLAIQAHIADEENEVQRLRASVSSDTEHSPEETENIFAEIDRLQKRIKEKIEEKLDEILRKLLAIIKETARRFKENEWVEVTASRHG